MFCAFCGVAIHWLRIGSTVLPSRVEVTVKPVSLRPASADETATTPASSTSASKRLRGVIFLPPCRGCEDGRAGALRLLQKCGNCRADVLCSAGVVRGPRPCRGPDRRQGGAAGRTQATVAARAAAPERERGRLSR